MCYNFKWNYHQIKLVTNKLRRILYIFKNVSDILKCNKINLIYQPFVGYYYKLRYFNIRTQLKIC